MATEPSTINVTPAQINEPRREFPKRDRQLILEEVDDHGDVVFRFKLDPRADAASLTLQEFYRESITDLLRIVRLFAGGKAVIVDAFAFLNAPLEPIPLAAPAPHEGTVGAAEGN